MNSNQGTTPRTTPVTEDANATAAQLQQRAAADKAAQDRRPDERNRDDAHPVR